MRTIFHFQLCVKLMVILQLAQTDIVQTVYLLGEQEHGNWFFCFLHLNTVEI